jgi:Uma2 family endonuclease
LTASSRGAQTRVCRWADGVDEGYNRRVDIELEPPYLIVKPFVSEEEFYREAGEDSDWEYLDGRLVIHSPASDRHEDLFSFLMVLLRGYLDLRRIGLVRGSRYPMRLDARWSPEPDLLVVRETRRHLLGQNRLEGPADFVIEIAADSDPGLDLREKLPRYREAGIDEIWLVNPFERTLRVETKRPAGYGSRTLAAGRLDSVVLPGFWIEVSWLWREELPSTLDCLREILGTL